ncbi:hypothetical protein CCR75_004432 [Bremia lactucae]|uniref:histone acetyltransferase n=1 Tax=Bremia lactucae TaxID=4779 RepID=A0A976NYA3_BRELC|nr:hypothetical protein CCR75_004432 [Bremia lactucae]
MDVQMEPQGSAPHEEKFRVYNAALVHAATCAETQCDAYSGRCHKVKASIDHFVRCYGSRRKVSPIESCEMCSKIWGLLCFHAKTCLTPSGQHCTVSQCNYLREKIARKRENDRRELQEARVVLQTQLEEWPVERRMAQLEADRQQVLALLAEIRAEKTPRSRAARCGMKK